MNDLRFAVRQLRRSPGFTVVVVLTLALGIGATTAIFTLLQGVLLRPLAYADAERIVTLWSYSQRRGNRYTVSTPDFRDWRAQSRSFEAMARLRRGRPTLLLGTPGAVAESVDIALVSEGFFPTMGASARAGGVGVQPRISVGLSAATRASRLAEIEHWTKPLRGSSQTGLRPEPHKGLRPLDPARGLRPWTLEDDGVNR